MNRDTLYVLLNFLHLVAENSEDKKGTQVYVYKAFSTHSTNLHNKNFSGQLNRAVLGFFPANMDIRFPVETAARGR